MINGVLSANKNCRQNNGEKGTLRIFLTVYEIKSRLNFEIKKKGSFRVTEKMTLFYYYLSFNLNDAALHFHYYQKVEYKYWIPRRFVLSSPLFLLSIRRNKKI